MGTEQTNSLWVYCDPRNERFFRFSLNILAKACELAQAVSGQTVAVLVGAPERPESDRECKPDESAISIARAAEEAVSHGAAMVLRLESRALAVPRADLYGKVLAQVMGQRLPRILLFPLNDFGRELAARTARQLHIGLIADCADLKVEGGKIVADCPSWAGQIMARIAFADHQKTGCATVQPTIGKAVRIQGKPGSMEIVGMDALQAEDRMLLVERRMPELTRRSLEEADVVVVGGAGVGSAEGFGRIRELAAAFGGEVGATRPPVLQHWVEENRMIGQTGKTVHPKLLLSIGASGAVQYTAGIAESQVIVAVNRDGNAPIFSTADFGIVGDWNTIVPALTAKLKTLVMRRLVDDLCDRDGKIGAASFGTRMCKIRESQGWTREALAQATDQAPEYISQVEKDEITPPVSFLLRLARALDVQPGAFLREEDKTAIRDRRSQGFIKRTRNYSYETLTPDAEAEHLRAFLVTIESRQAHEPVAYKHEGEEFVFVMEGALELMLGGKPFHLKKLESIRFNSDVPHKLKSLSDEATKCLVVLYSP